MSAKIVPLKPSWILPRRCYLAQSLSHIQGMIATSHLGLPRMWTGIPRIYDSCDYQPVGMLTRIVPT